MKSLYGRTVGVCLTASLTFLSISSFAEVQDGKVLVQSVTGDVTIVEDSGRVSALTANTELSGGVTIQTGTDGYADLLLKYNGTALRLTPASKLRLTKLTKEDAGGELVTETSVQLLSGAVVGSQRKLQGPSKFDIVLPDGVATIKGTEYLVRADGGVTVLSGAVRVNFNLPHNGGSVRVTVSAGYSFDPATGQVVPTTPAFLNNIIADINTVRNNAQTFKTSGATLVVQPEKNMSPTRGNNGVGNGIDPQPPGNPPINDGPGTGPGNPGNHGGANKKFIKKK